MDSLSFEGFHAQLDYKLMYGNKNLTQLTIVQCIKFRVQKQNKPGKMKKKLAKLA